MTCMVLPSPMDAAVVIFQQLFGVYCVWATRCLQSLALQAFLRNAVGLRFASQS